MVGLTDLSRGDPILLNLNNYSKQIIQEKHVYTKHENYSILNYDKHKISYMDVSSGLFRSIICSYPEKKILCYSPPNTLPVYMLKKNITDRYILINEAVEGVMINLFYDFRIEQWEIATKSGIGGNYSYNIISKKQKYHNGSEAKKSFYKMFLESLHLSENQVLNDAEFLKYLPKDMSYSFVLQHPENKICLHIDRTRLYLVSVYSIMNNPTNITEIRYINPYHYQNWLIFQNIEGIIEFPKLYEKTSIEELLLEKSSIYDSNKNRGKMITNIKTGERHFIEDVEYMKLFLKKGQQNKIFYTYLCLERIEKVDDYLYFFPKNKKAFRRFEKTFKGYIDDVYNSYTDKYISKETTPSVYKYLTHINKLHKEIYLPSLRKGTHIIKINKTIIRNYFMKMEPHVLFYHLGWKP